MNKVELINEVAQLSLIHISPNAITHYKSIRLPLLLMVSDYC